MTDLVVPLARRPIISGVVRDEAGQPLVDVEVAAFRRLNQTARLQLDQLVLTDDRGVYRLVVSEPADYLIRVRGSTSGARRVPSPPEPQPRAAVGYPTMFFPGVSRPTGAHPVSGKLNEETIGIDFALSPARGVRLSAVLAGVEMVPAGPLPLTFLPSTVQRFPGTCSSRPFASASMELESTAVQVFAADGSNLVGAAFRRTCRRPDGAPIRSAPSVQQRRSRLRSPSATR